MTLTEFFLLLMACSAVAGAYTLYVKLAAIVDELRDIGTLLADRSDDGGKAE